MAAYFTITGPVNGYAETLGWIEGEGFFEEETAGQAAINAIQGREEVCVTTTGPCFTAADHPAHVAFVTARSVFDALANLQYDGDAIPEILDTLEELMSVPEGATPWTTPS